MLAHAQYDAADAAAEAAHVPSANMAVSPPCTHPSS